MSFRPLNSYKKECFALYSTTKRILTDTLIQGEGIPKEELRKLSRTELGNFALNIWESKYKPVEVPAEEVAHEQEIKNAADAEVAEKLSSSSESLVTIHDAETPMPSHSSSFGNQSNPEEGPTGDTLSLDCSRDSGLNEGTEDGVLEELSARIDMLSHRGNKRALLHQLLEKLDVAWP